MNISADKGLDLRLIAAAAALLLSVVSIGMSIMTIGVWVGEVEERQASDRLRMAAIETRLDNRAIKISKLSDDMITNSERLAHLLGRIAQLQGQVDSAQAAINALPERLGKIETMIQELIGRLEREHRQGKLKLAPKT